MSHCSECGKKLSDNVKFCSECGTHRSEPKRSSNVAVHKKKHGFAFAIFAIFLLLVFSFAIYLGLNLWAITQLQVELSLDSVINSISDFDFQSGLTSTTVGTSLRVKNPTFVPVIASKISYDVSYGDTRMGKGSTGFIFIMPYSHTDTSANFKVSHIKVGKGVIEGVIDSLRQETKTPGVIIYVEFGPIKLPIGKVQ